VVNVDVANLPDIFRGGFRNDDHSVLVAHGGKPTP
jgi:hypothetical protein